MQITERLIAALSVSLLITSATVGVAVSHDAAPHDTPTTSHEVSTNELRMEQQDLQARLEERKLARPNAVSEVQQSRVRARCQAIQQRITTISTQVAARETVRQQRYESLVSTLDKLDKSLQASDASVDSFTLLNDELTTLVSGFSVTSAQYELALADMTAMDCELDPNAFQLTLEAAREYRNAAKESSESIRFFLQTKLKPALISLKNNL